MPGTTATDALLSRDEVSEFAALRDNLPVGWVVDVKPNAEMAWAAFVYQADASKSRPIFTIYRWDDRVGLLVQWMGRSASSAKAFTELWPILELIQSSIFAATQSQLATVAAEGCGDM